MGFPIIPNCFCFDEELKELFSGIEEKDREREKETGREVERERERRRKREGERERSKMIKR